MDAEFEQAWNRGAVRPVTREVLADFDTPLSAFTKCVRGDHRFLLESVEGGEVWGRYSFFGAEPFVRLTHRGGQAQVHILGEDAQPVDWIDGALDPLQALDALMQRMRAEVPPEAPRLLGGAIGFLAYDAIRFFEKIPLPDSPERIDAAFVIPEWLCVYDRLRSSIEIVAWPIRCGPDGTSVYASADAAWSWSQKTLDDIEQRLRQPVAAPATRSVSLEDRGFEPDDAVFEQRVSRIREYIAAGDVIQVVLSRPRTLATELHPLDAYRALRQVNPSPYMFYVQMEDHTLVGSSPEALVRVEGSRVTTRPIAGTRPRGENATEDARLEAELVADPKERAEHLMLVDLGRNDIGRVARIGTVEVPSFMRVERYSHVMHLVSDVVGELASDRTAMDAVRSCFPAGTLSGAPKIRAMEIISELEETRRGVYGGAVGYVSFDGNADTCIAIRTVEFDGQGTARVQAGAGIVHDSSPQAEAAETRAKSAGLVAALTRAAEGL